MVKTNNSSIALADLLLLTGDRLVNSSFRGFSAYQDLNRYLRDSLAY